MRALLFLVVLILLPCYLHAEEDLDADLEKIWPSNGPPLDHVDCPCDRHPYFYFKNCTCRPYPGCRGPWSKIRGRDVYHLVKHCPHVTMNGSLNTVPGPVLKSVDLSADVFTAYLTLAYAKGRCYDFRFCHPGRGSGWCDSYSESCCRVGYNNWKVLSVDPHSCNITVKVWELFQTLMTGKCDFQLCKECDQDSMYFRYHGNLQVTYIDRIVDSTSRCCKCRIIINRFRVCIKLPKTVLVCAPLITVQFTCPNVTIQAMLLRQELRFKGNFRPCDAFVVLEFCTITDWPFKLKPCAMCMKVAPHICACIFPSCSCCASCDDTMGSACVQKWKVVLFVCKGKPSHVSNCYEEEKFHTFEYRKFCTCDINCTDSKICMFDVNLTLCFDLVCRKDADCVLCDIKTVLVNARIQTADFCGVATVVGTLYATAQTFKSIGGVLVQTLLFKRNELLFIQFMVGSPDVSIDSVKIDYMYILGGAMIKYLVQNGAPTPLALANDFMFVSATPTTILVKFKVTTGPGPLDLFDLAVLTQGDFVICALLSVTYKDHGARDVEMRLAFGEDSLEMETNMQVTSEEGEPEDYVEGEEAKEEKSMWKSDVFVGGLAGGLGAAFLLGGTVLFQRKKGILGKGKGTAESPKAK